MRENISALLDKLISLGIYAAALVLPLLVLPFNTDFFEIPKATFLVGLVLVLLTLWSLSWIIKGKVVVTKTPLDVPLLILLAVVLVSTFISTSRFVSIFGNFPNIHGSATTWVSYILFYFIAASNIKTKLQVKVLYSILFTVTVISGAMAMLSFFGVFMPLPFAKSVLFNPTGSPFNISYLSVLLLPLALLSITFNNKFLSKGAGIVLASFLAIVIALIGSMATQVAAVVVLLLSIMVAQKMNAKVSIPLMLIPAIIAGAIYGISMIPNGANRLHTLKNNYNSDIQLNFTDSWKVAVSSFRDAPFFGTGPATFMFDFTAYKPIEFNVSPFWNLRFEVGFNEFFQVLATLGGLGFLAFIFFNFQIFSSAWRGIISKDHDILAVSLTISALTVIVLNLLHASSLVTTMSGLIILAMFMAVHRTISGKVEEFSIGIKASKLTDSNLIVGDILPVIIFIPIIIFVAIVSWNGIKTVQADVYHRQALEAAGSNGARTYELLVKAEQANPRIDFYRVSLAQTNFLLANNIAANAQKTASGAANLTDQEKQTIQQLLSQSIAEGRAAVALSPRNARNWEVLGSIYRQISGVADNALLFSLEAYSQAIKLDPLNPLLRINVGGVYYSIKNYDLAIRLFSDAASLKPDLANAFYNLSIALRDKGELQAAAQAAEKTVSLLDPKAADYKVASDYLADLKARAATGSAAQSDIVPPAAENNSALGQEIPNVDVEGLDGQPVVATPSAIPTPSPSPSPQASASPAQ